MMVGNANGSIGTALSICRASRSFTRPSRRTRRKLMKQFARLPPRCTRPITRRAVEVGEAHRLHASARDNRVVVVARLDERRILHRRRVGEDGDERRLDVIRPYLDERREWVRERREGRERERRGVEGVRVVHGGGDAH